MLIPYYKYMRVPALVKGAIATTLAVVAGKTAVKTLGGLQKPVKVEDIPAQEVDPLED